MYPNQGRFGGFSQTSAAAFDEGLRQHMLRVYNYMGLGLVVTGLVAFIVGTTPALTTVAPLLVNPRASSSSIHVPDSRVSRPMTNLGVEPGMAWTNAAPTRATVSLSSGALPALPRIPSVPNNFMVALEKSSPSLRRPSTIAAAGSNPGRRWSQSPGPTAFDLVPIRAR